MRNPRILVVDRSDELATLVQLVTAELRPRPEVVPCERVGGASDLLCEGDPFDVIMGGPSLANKTGLARLQLIQREAPGAALVLVFQKRPDVSLREIVRTGAVDLVHLPIDDEELVAVIERATDISRQRSAPLVPLAAETAASGPGAVVTIASPTGGCGKTFLATNLAYFLHRQTGRSVCIADLDLQFGEVSTALRLRPRSTIVDVLEGGGGDDPGPLEGIEAHLAEHHTGIRVLAAPHEPSDADLVTGPDVTRVLEALRARFGYVIVDTPAALNEQVLAAFDLSDQILVMATLDVPSVRNLSVFLSTLEKLKVSSEVVRLIINKAERDSGIDMAQVTKRFPQGFSMTLPYAPEVSRSVNTGTPILLYAPRAEVSRTLEAGLTTLIPEDERRQIDLRSSPASANGLSRLLRSLRSAEPVGARR